MADFKGEQLRQILIRQVAPVRIFDVNGSYLGERAPAEAMRMNAECELVGFGHARRIFRAEPAKTRAWTGGSKTTRKVVLGSGIAPGRSLLEHRPLPR